jgi:6-hydroxytryprostatin B O-methyltransferase
MQQFASLRWLCHFAIPSLVPPAKPIPYADVASAANVPERHLRSVARMAIANNFLSEPEPGLLSHSNLSAEIVSKPHLLDWASYLTGTTAPTAAKMVEQTKKYGSSQAKNETAYNIAMETDLSFFDHTASSLELTRTFAGYMKSVTASDGVNIKHLLNGYDWASLQHATVVDVGCSSF